jgi:hypothetical protein
MFSSSSRLAMCSHVAFDTALCFQRCSLYMLTGVSSADRCNTSPDVLLTPFSICGVYTYVMLVITMQALQCI